MKKLLLLAIFVGFCFVGFSQFKPKYVHCLLMGQLKLNGQITVVIDYGDIESTGRASQLVDSKDIDLKFGSMVAALNYMGMHGWEFVQAYTLSVGDASIYHYLLRKPFDELAPETKKLYTWED
ncbi:MAG: hypothetical protein WCX31_04525 [Salinivirgaceae bacterium]|jgi:hypothetical protein